MPSRLTLKTSMRSSESSILSSFRPGPTLLRLNLTLQSGKRHSATTARCFVSFTRRRVTGEASCFTSTNAGSAKKATIAAVISATPRPIAIFTPRVSEIRVCEVGAWRSGYGSCQGAPLSCAARRVSARMFWPIA